MFVHTVKGNIKQCAVSEYCAKSVLARIPFLSCRLQINNNGVHFNIVQLSLLF